MDYRSVRKYIDLHGPIKATREDGAQLTMVADPDHINDWGVEEIRYGEIYHRPEGYGFTVESGNHPHGGYYRVDEAILDGIDAIALEENFTFELRHLLPATKAQVKHYRELENRSGFDLVDKLDPEGVKVYGLIATAYHQQGRASVFVCPTSSSGITNCGHRVQGYMVHDQLIKFDSIQAWRVRELTRAELVAFDPDWGNLVK